MCWCLGPKPKVLTVAVTKAKLDAGDYEFTFGSRVVGVERKQDMRELRQNVIGKRFRAAWARFVEAYPTRLLFLDSSPLALMRDNNSVWESGNGPSKEWVLDHFLSITAGTPLFCGTIQSSKPSSRRRLGELVLRVAMQMAWRKWNDR